MAVKRSSVYGAQQQHLSSGQQQNMDVVTDYRDDLRLSAVKMKWLKVDKWRGSRSRGQREEDEEAGGGLSLHHGGEGGEEEGEGQLVEVRLRGRAPWGFTLRGGREHREPLVITKVEEGSEAAAVSLQAGDEMVSVNSVPLSGSRQQAICLVKSSQGSLALVVRRKVAMVDIVSPRAMPSESDMRAARGFLTKILRSSMRKSRFKGRNEPASRPHSWHSSKLTEDGSEVTGSEPTPAPIWQHKHEARSLSTELSNQGEQSNLPLMSSQSSSVNNMERLERPSHPFPPRCLSPTKHPGSTEPLPAAGTAKRDSGFSCLAGASSPPGPDPCLPGGKGTGTENIFFNGPPSEGPRQGERSRYPQHPLGNGGWEGSRASEQERSGSRASGAGRPNNGPVWQVPDRKKTQSPPPPPPPLRSDSFAATKVFPYSDGPGVHSKGQGRGGDRPTEASIHKHHRNGPNHHERGPDVRRSFMASKGFLHPSMAADHNHNQVHPNKLFSLSSNDVRQTQAPFAYPPSHQRQYSDESPFFQTRMASASKPQSVGSYYRSLQELPTNISTRKHVRHSNSAANQNTENGGYNRYLSVTAKHSGRLAEPQARQVKAESWRGDTETSHWANGNDRSSCSVKNSTKTKYSLPQSQIAYGDIKDHAGHSATGSSRVYDHPASDLPASVKGGSSEDGQKRVEEHSNDVKRHSPNQPSNGQKASPPRLLDLWLPQDDHRISPQKTPLLHSLTQESRSQAERQAAANSAANARQSPLCTQPLLRLDPPDTTAGCGSGKAGRRSDRYATALRNEIQEKRAQLQKSRSAATLTCKEEDEEEAEGWRSTETSASSDGSFSNSYKDHLKEAQARVLQATSFQRRDLEPAGAEAAPPAGKSSSGGNGQISRIGGRKRFPLAKRIHSFSEPDKIDKLGMAEGESKGGSFGERRKLFEAKPAFARPALKLGQPGSSSDLGEAGNAKTRTVLHEESQKGQPSDPDKQASLEQQRLGTFAEYQASWNMQRKPSDAKKTKGRYHSAENILDTDVEEKAVCIHERSRSSPSADFYSQNIPWREPAEAPQTESTPGQHNSDTTRGNTEVRIHPPAGQLDLSPQPAPSAGSDCSLPVHPDHSLLQDTTSPSHSSGGRGLPVSPTPPPRHSPSPGPGSQQHTAAQPSQTKSLLPLPSRPHHSAPETTSSSQEFLASGQAEPLHRSSSPLPRPCSPRGQGCDSSIALSSSSSPSSPRLGRRMSGPDPPHRAGAGEDGVERHMERRTPVITMEPPTPPCASSSSSSSASFSFLSFKTAESLFVPSSSSADRARSPSPQFAPRRLTDRPPPVSTQDDASARSENDPSEVMEVGSPVRKVPVKIVHSESSSERAGRAYLPHNPEGPDTAPEGRRPSQIASLGSTENATPSPFSAYTRPGSQGPQWHRPSQDLGQSALSDNSGALQLSEEDAKREALARDIMDRDKSLVDILDQSSMKTTMDLMEGLFPQGESLLEEAQCRRKASSAGPRHRDASTSPRNTDDRREEVSLVPSSSYYNTSAPKAELLIMMKDMQGQLEDEGESEDELDTDLSSKKMELIDSLSCKLEVLRGEARAALQEEVESNEALGRGVEEAVQRLCRPNQLERFRMFVGDLDKVVSLLLSLSGRLARVENALNGLEEDGQADEKRTLTEKRQLLIRQHEDARELKENLDRRERAVSAAMEERLDAEGLADYRHFVKMKSALIIEQRKLEDRIKLGEEQLACLVDSLPLEQRVLF